MAILDASLSEVFFGTETQVDVVIGGGATGFVWQTPSGGRVNVFGTGFSYIAGIPTGGTVTSIEFDFVDDDHPVGTIDGTLTGLSVPLIDLLSIGVPPAGEISFWETATGGGGDTIVAPQLGNAAMTGDFTSVVSGNFNGILRTGGDDLFTAFVPVATTGLLLSRGGGATGLIGDALFVEGTVNGQIANFADVDGGDDTMRLTGFADYVMTGDVFEVSTLGGTSGGDDDLRSDATVISILGGTVAAGDVFENSGFVAGGRDTIAGTNFAFTLELLAGDVNVQSGGTTLGGADTISGRAGQERIAGDVASLRGGVVTGGADFIRGGEDSDIVSGDVLSIDGRLGPVVVTLTGGADRIHGDNGNDWIAGDLWNAQNVNAASGIAGGADRIYGGAGDDTLHGDVDAAIAALLDSGGDDTIDGGLGDDLIDGQLGIDTASFATEAFAVVTDLLTGLATGQGSDSFAGIENLTGSALNDTLRGDNGANRLMGGAGNDTLFGRGGADTLFGGDGNDTIAGGSGADTMIGNAGADVFVEGPALGGAAALDRINDFQNGTDRIDLQAYNFAGFAAVLALTAASGGGIRIDVPGAESLQVTGLTPAAFNSADVIL